MVYSKWANPRDELLNFVNQLNYFYQCMGQTDLFFILKLSLDKIFVKYSYVRCPIVHDMCQERKLFIRPLALLYI